jgi:SAM-dependent methyltransferase
LKPLKRRFPQGAQLWEIGSAYGFFLREASAHFRVAGCDISEHAAGFAERELGVSVVVADYLEIPPPTEEFDVVCMWDTIEHLRDPAETVAKAFMELRPGGEIAISTGDVSSLLARVRGHRWRLIHPPTHLHYFSAGSIRSLLTRTGFRDISISHPSFWRSADAVAFRLLGYPSGKPAAPVYRMLKSAGVLNFAFPLNLGDLMVVTARK